MTHRCVSRPADSPQRPRGERGEGPHGGPRACLLGVVLVAWALSACAAGPADRSLDAEANLFRALAGKACIYVVPSNSTAAVTVTMDGRKVGTLGEANYLRLDVLPGRYVLSVTPFSLAPAFLRGTPESVTVEAEASHCYFLRALWTQDERNWRSFRIYLGRVTEEEGEREVNVRTLILPTQ